jgi:hypothetical protein
MKGRKCRWLSAAFYRQLKCDETYISTFIDIVLGGFCGPLAVLLHYACHSQQMERPV